tara:strand:- start:103 stop:450 length:348 start_codon:yes stop_codon:yes gene_type:complete
MIDSLLSTLPYLEEIISWLIRQFLIASCIFLSVIVSVRLYKIILTSEHKYLNDKNHMDEILQRNWYTGFMGIISILIVSWIPLAPVVVTLYFIADGHFVIFEAIIIYIYYKKYLE